MPSPDATLRPSSSEKVPERKVQSLLAEGERLWSQGNYDDAIASFRMVLKIDPKNSAAASGIRKSQKAKTDEEKALIDTK